MNSQMLYDLLAKEIKKAHLNMKGYGNVVVDLKPVKGTFYEVSVAFQQGDGIKSTYNSCIEIPSDDVDIAVADLQNKYSDPVYFRKTVLRQGNIEYSLYRLVIIRYTRNSRTYKK